MRTRWRRNKVLVGRLQCRFVGFLLGYFVLLMTTLVGVLVIPPAIDLSLHENDFSIASSAATQLLYLHNRLWPAMVAILVLFLVHAVLFSHRVAGPLVRLRRIFREIGHGDLSQTIRIRKRDHLHLEVEAINGMVGDLRTLVGEVRAAEGDARAAAARLESVTGSGRSDDLAELVFALDRVDRALEEFRLGEKARAAASAEPPVDPGDGESVARDREQPEALVPAGATE